MTTLSTTAPTASAVARRSTLWSRSLAVARMHLADRMTLLVLPTVTLAAVFAINAIIWAFVPSDGRNSGGLTSIYCFLIAVAVLAVARSLPFALGMGSSRRAFLIGTLTTGVALSVGYGLLLLVLQLIERATGGWWCRGSFFWLRWYDGSSYAAVLLFTVASLLAGFVLGALLSACWQRWNRLFLLVGGPAVILVGGGLLVMVTAEHWWGSVGDWLSAQTPLSAAGWCAVAVVVLGAALHPVLRRVRG